MWVLSVTLTPYAIGRDDGVANRVSAAVDVVGKVLG